MNAPLRLCLIEDDPIMGESLVDCFQFEGFAVDWHQRAGDAAVAMTRRDYAVVISDIRLPDREGGELFLELAAGGARLPPFVFITGFGTIDRAVQLLKAGAADYVTKPFDPAALVERVRALAAERPPPLVETPLGVSPAMRRIADSLPRLALHADTVLITGESGVGKEFVAQQLHRQAGKGAAQAFVAVNCAAMPEGLMEAELFGYEKGAFTGASRSHKGHFEQAHRGTLFLDEIGEMPLAMQAKLLRALQDRRITRLGGTAPVAVDFRLVCATHRDLKAMVEAGSFREDLFYRIHVVQLRIPPLRERKDDILWFAGHFLEELSQAMPGAPLRLDAAAETALLDYPWPGNLRELRNVLKRAAILSDDRVLGAAAIFEDIAVESVAPESPRLADYLQRTERDYLIRALNRNNGLITRTATELGISRKSLWEKMRRLGIENAAKEEAGDGGR